jgi:hypothetical protein
MKTRLVLLLAVLAVLGAALWFTLRGGERTEGVAEQATRVGSAAPESAESFGSEGERARRSELAEPEEPPVSAAANSAARTWSGAFVLERADGGLDARASAEFSLLLRSGDERELRSVRVRARDGRWTAECPGDLEREAKLGSVSAATSGGRSLAVLAPQGIVRLDPGFEVRVREARRTWLHVVDLASGVELTGVELLDTRGAVLAVAPPRAEDRAALALSAGGSLRSPVDLASFPTLEQGEATLLARAPGYAWTPITLEVGGGVERTVALGPGGDLRVRVLGNAHFGPDVRFVLRRASTPLGRPLCRLDLGATEVLSFEGLAPERYLASAELGVGGAVTVLGSVEAEVSAGGNIEVTLVVEAAARARTAPLSALLLVPEAWMAETVEAQVLALEPGSSAPTARAELVTEPAEGEEGHVGFRLSHPALEVGRYALEVERPHLRVELDLPPGGLSDLRLVALPPAECILRVIDEGSGATLRPRFVEWSPFEDGAIAGSPTPESYSGELDGFRIVSVPGEVLVTLDPDSGWELALPRQSIREGRSEAEAIAVRRTEVELVLTDGGVPVPFPPGWGARFFREGAVEPLQLPVQVSETLRRYRLPAGGPYRIEPDSLADYEPLLPQDFVAPDRTRGRIELKVVKLR